MEVLDFVMAHGGSARWRQIRYHFTQRQLEAALRSGEIVRAGRGMYSVKYVTPFQDAKRLNGAVSHYTAARVHAMGTIHEPGRVDIAVDPHRSNMQPPPHVRLRYVDVPPEDVDEHRVTTPLRTAVDCARSYPLSIGLVIAETGVLQGKIDLDDLGAVVGKVRGPGAPAARRVLRAIDLRPQSPMETYTRAVLLEAGIDCFEPQYQVIVDGVKITTADLGDPVTRTLINVVDPSLPRPGDEPAESTIPNAVLAAHGYQMLRVGAHDLRDDATRVVDLVRMSLERHGVKK